MLSPSLIPQQHVSLFKRGAVWALPLFALGLLAVLLGIHLYSSYRAIQRDNIKHLTTMARIAGQNLEYQIHQANRALSGLDHQRHALHDDDSDVDLTVTVHRRAAVSSFASMWPLDIISPKGIIVASSVAENIGLDVSKRRFFQAAVQSGKPDLLHIAPPQTDAPGSYSLRLTRELSDERGVFKGLVSAALNDAYFHTLMDTLRFAHGVWSALIHEDGHFFLMLSESANPASMELGTAGEFFREHRRGGLQQSISEGRVYNLQDTQVVALFTVRSDTLAMHKSLTVAVGRGTDEVFAPWRRQALLQSGMFLVVCLLTVLGLQARRRHQAESTKRNAQAKAALRKNAEGCGLILENTTDMVVRIDTQGRIAYANPAFCGLLGKPRNALLRSKITDSLVEEEKARAITELAALVHPPHTATFRHAHHTTKGVRHLHWQCRGLLNQDGQVDEILSIGRDVTEHVTQLNQLELLAQQDFLTGLSNRRHFLEQGEIEVKRARRFKSCTSLLLMDLDHFEAINVTYGQKGGDQVLRALGQILRACLRQIDVSGRLGGEEFAVLLPATNLDAASKVAQRLGATIRAHETALDDGTVMRFTTSIGISTADYHECSLEKLMEDADAALCQAKHMGRDRVCIADAARDARYGIDRPADQAT